MTIKMFVKISLVCATSRWRHGTCTSMLMGVIVGMALSLIMFPLIYEECLDLNDDPVGKIGTLESDSDLSGSAGAMDSNTDADDYEPRIILEGPGKKSPKTTKTPVRPRFYSTELGIREKLFVAVISSAETISALSVAANTTLAHHVDKLVLFVRNQRTKTTHSNSLVYLKSDAPVTQFFLDVLRYIGTKYAKDYDYFFVADSTTFIRGCKLMSLIGRISVSRHVYMGYSEDAGSQFCDIGGGILFSNSVLRALQRKVTLCLHEQDASDGPSEQIGKCVQRISADLSSQALRCQRTVQGQHFSTYRIPEESKVLSDGSKILENCPDMDSALTVQPVTTDEQWYRLHLHFSGVELRETKAHIRHIRAEIEATDQSQSPSEPATWPIGVAPRFEARDRFSVIRWEYLSASAKNMADIVVYPEDDFNVARNLTVDEVRQVQEVINASIAVVRKRDDRDLRLRRIINAYRRYDLTRGLDYLLDLEFVDVDSGRTVEKRVQAVMPLGKVELVPIPYVTENTRLVLVLPVTIVHQESARKFLAEFTEMCLEKLDNSILIMVFLYDHSDRLDANDIHRPIKDVVTALNNRYHAEGAKLSWISVKTTDSLPSEFGMLDLVSKKFPLNTLFLVCHPGMEIHADYLNRVRMNTIAGHQVFFPIPFAQFHPDIVFRSDGSSSPVRPPAKIEIHKTQGHFAEHSFDHYAFYNSDYQSSRRLVEHEVPVARNDRDLTRDVRHRAKTGYDVYATFLLTDSLHVMRAVEPSLRVRFHAVVCQPELSPNSYEQCVAEWFEGLAGRSELASLLLDYEKDTRTT